MIVGQETLGWGEPEWDPSTCDGREKLYSWYEDFDLAHGRRETVLDDDQIVVLIQRQFIRVERAFRQRGRREQLLGATIPLVSPLWAKT